MNFYTSVTEPTATWSKELLFVGFERSFDQSLHNFPHHRHDYTLLYDRKEVTDWMEQRVENLDNFAMPYGILCDLKWLERDNFQLAQMLSTHPDWSHVPFIVISNGHTLADKTTLVRYHVDDCYTAPVNWSRVETRLDFLNQYKSTMLEVAHEVPVEQLRVPIRFSKRLFDIAVASGALLVLSPLLALTAIAIRLESPGPIFYRSKRVGSGYQVFDFLKFRSMYKDADKRLQELSHLNQYRDNQSLFVKIAQDPRITRVGRIIRKYSIDELPQLINILRGDMSIVGNRPLPLYEARQLTNEEWCARFLAPAGLTGLWQVSRRGRTDMSAEERIALDLDYARQHNIWMDIKIVLRTFTAFIQKENV